MMYMYSLSANKYELLSYIIDLSGIITVCIEHKK